LNTRPTPFSSYPLSPNTAHALTECGFTTTTNIQSATLPYTLNPTKDVLACGQTGSGKTLSFLIPTIESLYRLCWSPSDGLHSIIITPTRELAMQIFSVLQQIARYHRFNVGLVTGGKKQFKQEQVGIVKVNCVVATPGRILAHLESTYGFTADSLQTFVIDEADKCLELGFAEEVDRLVSYLPSQRQTMLFSATQTKKVRDLARLSLKRPVYVAVSQDVVDDGNESDRAPDEETKKKRKTPYTIPATLKQTYITVPLHLKVSVLYSFLKTHLKSKTIVFLSTRSQIKFFHGLFSSFQPGLPLLSLHGKQSQQRRTSAYFEFSRKTGGACLFTTDVASRGLDFPGVDWVFMADAPEDVEMYVHRVGRTARNNKSGTSLMLLTPSEESGFVKMIKSSGIDGLKKLSVNPNKALDVQKKTSAGEG